MMTTKLGDLNLHRMGYGTMRLPGIKGTPVDNDLAVSLLQEAVRLGTNVIDSAQLYGMGLANRLIAKALAPYPNDLVICTKVGVSAGKGGRPIPAASPEEIQVTVAQDLESLGVDSLDLVFLRLPGGPLPQSQTPMRTSLEYLKELQQQGLIRHLGLSCASLAQIHEAQAITPIAAIQNALFLGHRDSRDVIQFCHQHGLPFLAYFPLGMGNLIPKHIDLKPLASTLQATPAQIALAWLLAQSPMVIPIPGTTNIMHLRENAAALQLRLEPHQLDDLDRAVRYD